GSWEVCEDSDFRGRCVVLRRGQYPSLAAMGLGNRISSLRRVSGGGRYTYAPPPAPPAPPQYAYYPRGGERLYQANVVAVRAVTGPPEQRC
ncbi:beta/gamma crystallin-related protein, partial [Salmonella sp. SAL4446]|uniref:beta/gamma crystallin-related protein n=1 Tax=Salmonella sp. SAL4446 TaxID=3159901 RepID=UPI0039794938